jgi:putative hydrolase of the HAD superfamily
VDAILFDLSEVYLRGLKGTHRRLGSHLNMPVADDAFLGAEATRLFHGEITEEEYWRALIAANDWTVEVDDLRGMVRANFAPIEGTESLIRELKASGHRLGLLSVHAREWVEYCEREFRHHRYFDTVVYSYECGVSKPEAAAYEYALKALGAEARRTVFVDDSAANVRAAEELGMLAVRFESADQLGRWLIEKRLLPGSTSPRAAD